MPRLPRIHVPGGLYYVHHCCNGNRPLFDTPNEYSIFENVFARALDQFEVSAHAFCWLPTAIHLALQIGTIKLSRFMRAVTSQYVKSLPPETRPKDPLFSDRYSAVVFEAKYLQQLAFYIHSRPGSADSGKVPPDYPWSSHRAYMQEISIPWLTTHVLLHTFAHNTDAALKRYTDFMHGSENNQHPTTFADHGSRDPRVVGDALFLVTLPRDVPIIRTTRTLDDIIHAVLMQQGLSLDELITSKNTRAGTLGRALVAFHAVDRGIATYTEAAPVLRRSVSALVKAVKRYSKHLRYAHLFKPGALRSVVPIAMPPAAST